MIRFGVVGTNWITDRFIKDSMTLSEFVFTAVYSRTEARARAFAEKYNSEEVSIYTDLKEMARSGRVDAVYIASPNTFHAEQATLFLNEGIHVLCEKPLAANTQEVDAMFTAARENHVLLMEAMKSTVLPGFKVVQEYLHKIGHVRRYASSFCRYTDRYDAYQSGEHPHVFNPEFSSGSLMDLGVYCIYPLVVLFGEPRAIRAAGHILESGVDGEGSLLISYDGMDACIMHSKITTSYLSTEIQGEEGTIIIDKISTPKQIILRDHDGREQLLYDNDEPHPMSYETKEFINLIQSGKGESSVNSYKHSKITASILEKARKELGILFPADKI